MRSQLSLSQTPALTRFAKLSETHRDQRSHRRYPINLEVEYELLNRGRVERLGSGTTLDISTGGVLFEANDALPRAGRIELMMTWPFSLEGVCALKLAVQGQIVRNDGKRIAISVDHHEFRTAGRSLSKDTTKSCRA
jgi:PilZ domain